MGFAVIQAPEVASWVEHRLRGERVSPLGETHPEAPPEDGIAAELLRADLPREIRTAIIGSVYATTVGALLQQLQQLHISQLEGSAASGAATDSSALLCRFGRVIDIAAPPEFAQWSIELLRTAIAYPTAWSEDALFALAQAAARYATPGDSEAKQLWRRAIGIPPLPGVALTALLTIDPVDEAVEEFLHTTIRENPKAWAVRSVTRQIAEAGGETTREMVVEVLEKYISEPSARQRLRPVFRTDPQLTRLFREAYGRYRLKQVPEAGIQDLLLLANTDLRQTLELPADADVSQALMALDDVVILSRFRRAIGPDREPTTAGVAMVYGYFALWLLDFWQSAGDPRHRARSRDLLLAIGDEVRESRPLPSAHWAAYLFDAVGQAEDVTPPQLSQAIRTIVNCLNDKTDSHERIRKLAHEKASEILDSSDRIWVDGKSMSALSCALGVIDAMPETPVFVAEASEPLSMRFEEQRREILRVLLNAPPYVGPSDEGGLVLLGCACVYFASDSDGGTSLFAELSESGYARLEEAHSRNARVALVMGKFKVLSGGLVRFLEQWQSGGRERRLHPPSGADQFQAARIIQLNDLEGSAAARDRGPIQSSVHIFVTDDGIFDAESFVSQYEGQLSAENRVPRSAIASLGGPEADMDDFHDAAGFYALIPVRQGGS